MSFKDQLHASIQRRAEEKCRRRLPLKATSADTGYSRLAQAPRPAVRNTDPNADDKMRHKITLAQGKTTEAPTPTGYTRHDAFAGHHLVHRERAREMRAGVDDVRLDWADAYRRADAGVH
jgi:hypothetical protein